MFELTRLAGRLPRALREKVACFLVSSQRPDGGWAGRAGGSDPYYTSFALRLADVLGIQKQGLWPAAAGFLADGEPEAGIAGVLNRAECAGILAQRLHSPSSGGLAEVSAADALQPYRRTGGFALRPGGPLSCYATFLAWRTCLASRQPVPWAPEAARAVLALQRVDGGFSDAESEASGASPTAAAVCVICAGERDLASLRRAAAFLASLQRPDGGFAASGLVPFGDLLSSFTVLTALRSSGNAGMVRLGDLARFVRGLALDGAWRSCASDRCADVEYAYYGFACLCLLASLAGGTVCPCSRTACG